MNSLITKWCRRIVASLFFIGYFPVAPGTIGSALTVTAIWFLHGRYPAFFNPAQPLIFWIASLALIAVSIYLSNDAAGVFGRDDPPQIIIDECAGQCITFFLVPLSLHTLVLGFALFRFFDVVKPFPVYKLEDLEDGVGVTMDDVAAGVMSNLSIHAVIFIYHVIRAWLS